jgi:ribosomal protein S18 acetylase RimI-like enzyme
LDNKIWFLSIENNIINGFISAVGEGKKAYITLCFGEIDVISELIKALEEEVKNKSFNEIWIHFFNPVQLPWYPLENVIHPGIQGVDTDSTLYSFYKENGYENNSLQETYYLDLNDYKERFLFYPNRNYSIEFYQKKKHKGFTEFLENLNAEHWKNMLQENHDSANPKPLLVVLTDNQVIGFAGPLSVSKEGRGVFGGIAVLPEYRGLRLGKYLFNNLCKSFKDMNASYMTLFTGYNNIAKHIYINSGFKVVKKFMTMKKEI